MRKTGIEQNNTWVMRKRRDLGVIKGIQGNEGNGREEEGDSTKKKKKKLFESVIIISSTFYDNFKKFKKIKCKYTVYSKENSFRSFWNFESE